MSVDSQGRFDLTTLQERVRRLCNAFQYTLDAAGDELPTPPVIGDQNISNTDITEQLNSSLMAAYMALLDDTPGLFAQILYMTVVFNQDTYSLPAGTIQVSYIKMLPPGLQLGAPPGGPINPPTSPLPPLGVQPFQWVPLYEYDEDNLDTTAPSGVGFPTYRRDDDKIILSILPPANIPNGLQLRLITLPPPLSAPKDVIRTSLARIIQEFVIYDSAYVLYDTRKKAVPESIAQGRAEWNERLVRAAENMNHPRFTQLRSNRMIKWSYSGR